MITIYDRADMARVLTLDLDLRLRALLEKRFASLITEDGDLTDWTEFLIVELGDTEGDIAYEVGFSPLVDPLDGRRFGTPGFQPFWDHLIDHVGWWELTISFGSSFACVLFITKETAIPSLFSMCAQYNGRSDQS